MCIRDRVQGAISDSGLLEASASIFNSGMITLAGGTLETPDLMVSGTLEGYGVVNTTTLENSNDIVAQGGVLVLGGTIYNFSNITVMASAALDITGSLSGAPVMFMGGDALITVDDPAHLATGVQNMIATDAIDLVGVAPSLVTYSGGTGGALYIENAQGTVLAMPGIEIAPNQPTLSIVSDLSLIHISRWPDCDQHQGIAMADR